MFTGDCQECGGYDPTGTGFCGHDCRAARADREARHQVQQRRRRDNDDAFGREVDRLRGAGHTDTEIDQLLAHMP